MRNKEIVCEECEAEFEILHDSDAHPEFCPFCGDKLKYELDEDTWEDETDDNDHGC